MRADHHKPRRKAAVSPCAPPAVSRSIARWIPPPIFRSIWRWIIRLIQYRTRRARYQAICGRAGRPARCPLRPVRGRLGPGDEVPAAGLTLARRCSRTELELLATEGGAPVSSGRSLLRRTSSLLLLGCCSAVLAAPALAQPAPDPAPAPPTQPKPEAPGAKPQPQPQPPPPPSPPAPSPPPAPVQAVQPPPAPAPLLPTRLSPPPGPTPPPAPAARTRAPIRKAPRTAKKKPVKRAVATKRAVKKRVSALSAAAVKSSPSDSMLLAGGLALVVLVLGDTILLALSRRYLRV